jgi:hypothetical protein
MTTTPKKPENSLLKIKQKIKKISLSRKKKKKRNNEIKRNN